MKIKIAIPEKSDKWKVSIHGKFAKVSSVGVAYRRVERYLTKSLNMLLHDKTCVSVGKVHGRRFEEDNESLESDNPNYLIYSLACFLEEFLEPNCLRNIYRKYLRNSNLIPLTASCYM